MSLQRIIEYSEKNDIKVSWRYADLIVDLISRRPSVLAEAIDSFADLRSIAIKVVFDEFSSCSEASDDSKVSEDPDQSMIELKLVRGGMIGERLVRIPLPLVRSISVFLSLWKDEFRSIEGDSSKYVDALTDALLCQNAEGEEDENRDTGLVSAKTDSKQGTAVPVELWIMLAKARSDVIARRAALSAPATFLPRLLLCSGLPRASLLTMIDRLGRLGQRAADMTNTYLDLLAPSASSHWDIGRIGARRQISRKLLGRLTSYMTLHGIGLSEDSTEVSTVFFKWLSETLAEDTNSTKGKDNKSKHVQPHPHSISLLKTVASELDDSLVCDKIQPFCLPEKCSHWIEPKYSKSVPKKAEGLALAFGNISKRIGQGDDSSVEAMLHLLLQDENQSNRCEAAATLVSCMYKQENPKEGALALLLRWVPELTKSKGSPKLWKEVFSKSASEKVASNLIVKCIEEWASSHKSYCLEWICKEIKVDDDAVHTANVARFLINVIPVTFGSFIHMAPGSSRNLDILAIEGITRIAMACLKNSSSYRDHRALLGYDLVLWVSGLGKSRFQSISARIILEIGSGNDHKLNSAFSAVLLRLYLKHPSWLDLSSERTRQLLMKASALFEEEFVSWNSMLDDQIDQCIESISRGQFRTVKNLSDMARKHPLIVLRKAKIIASVLELDALKTKRDDDIRGVVHGEGIDGSREVQFMSKTMNLTVRHWGFSYTEPVWAAFLDVLTSVPQEVLFGCGFRMGLIDFLTPYLKLLSVQLQLLNKERSKRLQSKLADLFQNYQQHNPDEWRLWLSTKIEENAVRNLLITCDFITPQQAIESLKPVT